MPIYEYACKKCGNEWELTQKISDPPPKTCPSCKSKRVEKLLSLSSFSLKGGGWYSEGYASAGAGKGEKSSTKSAETSTKSDTASSGKASSSKKDS